MDKEKAARECEKNIKSEIGEVFLLFLSHFSLFLYIFAPAIRKRLGIGLGYGVMVAQEVLVLLVLVRTRVVQPTAKVPAQKESALLLLIHNYQFTTLL